MNRRKSPGQTCDLCGDVRVTRPEMTLFVLRRACRTIPATCDVLAKANNEPHRQLISDVSDVDSHISSSSTSTQRANAIAIA